MSANERQIIEIAEADLPLHCPTPDMSTWDSHPRVYLPIGETEEGEHRCPYCGILYRLKKPSN